ncbi:MAG: DUF1573 domain-containing protein, partial [Thermoanaerobaculia bacterium]
MSDDWSTVSVKREQMKRELDALRQHYLDHRATVDRLAGDAPTEHLAARYREVRAEIDAALVKLTELERPSMPPPAHPAQPPAASHPPVPPPAAPRRWDEIENPPATVAQSVTVPEEVSDESSAARTFIIILLGFLVITLLAYFGWRYLSGQPDGDDAVIEEQTATVEEVTTTSPAEPDVPVALTMSPPEIDFGTVKKGTRVVRKFEIVNNTDAPLVVKVERSTCRCL